MSMETLQAKQVECKLFEYRTVKPTDFVLILNNNDRTSISLINKILNRFEYNHVDIAALAAAPAVQTNTAAPAVKAAPVVKDNTRDFVVDDSKRSSMCSA